MPNPIWQVVHNAEEVGMGELGFLVTRAGCQPVCLFYAPHSPGEPAPWRNKLVIMLLSSVLLQPYAHHLLGRSPTGQVRGRDRNLNGNDNVAFAGDTWL